MKTLIIVPAFNEEKSIASVIIDLKKHGFKNILLVNDGSLDDTASKAKGVKIINHIINRGLGAALGTGFEYAKLNNYDIAVTFDSDGQHKAKDIKKLLAKIGRADVVIGSRLLKNTKDMPVDRIVINVISNLLTFAIYGIWSTDSQSGLRAFNKKSIECIKIKTQRMEVSSEFLKEIKRNNLRFVEVSIDPIYTEYSRQSGQSNLNSFNVAIRMLLRLFR